MTPKERAAMQQALEALESCNVGNWSMAFDEFAVVEAITTLREALSEQAEQPVSQEYQDHLVNQSFDWAAMAAKHQFMEGYRIGLAEMREKCAKVASSMVLPDASNYPFHISAAIRAIKFEGDTGFRPVSEMIAEHKQDHKKGAAIEKAKMRKATRAEKIAMSGVYEVPVEQAEQEPVIGAYEVVNEKGDEWSLVYPAAVHRYKSIPEERITQTFYAAPVRTKDLTDDEIDAIEIITDRQFARAVIAADRELNK